MEFDIKNTNNINIRKSLMCLSCYDYINLPNMNLNVLESYKDPIHIYISLDDLKVCNTCNCQTRFAEIDRDIVDIISVLNKKGYYTIASNSGINQYSPDINIYFEAELLIKKAVDKYNLPEHWRLDKSTYPYNIRVDYEYLYKDAKVEDQDINIYQYYTYEEYLEIKAICISNIRTWANSIPDSDEL